MKLKTIFEIVLLLLTSSYLFSQTNPQDPTGQIQIQIENLIQSQFGSGYDFGFDVLDSIIGKAGDGDKELVQDPYGTLNGCIIFNAGKAIEDDSGFIGIVRNGQIVWYSDPIVGGSWTGVFASRDLNNDGRVEILSAFFRGSITEVQYMWIISWDGQQGQIINQIDSSSNNSTIIGCNEMFDLIDQDTLAPVKLRTLWDNEEFSGYFPVERVSTYPYVTYDWNGTEYGLWPNTNQIPADTYFPANRLSVVVGCTVRRIADSLNYNYTWRNLQTSKQGISRFALSGIEHNFTSYEPGGWEFLGLWRDKPITEWEPLFALLKYGVLPGYIKEGIILKSLSLPSIVKYYIQGNRPKTDVDFSTEEGRNGFKNDFFNNSIFSYTIAPKDPPSPFDSFIFLDTLNSYTTQSRTLGWITEQSTVDKYTTLFDSAKVQLQRDAIRATRTTLDTVMVNANRDSSSTLSSEAYALIYFNTEYLLNQLPIPPPQYNLNIDTVGNGTVTKTPELALYDSSTTVLLTANPSTGYRFSQWSGDAIGTVNPISVVMDGNKNITATFLQNTFIITATSGTNGTITPSGDVSVTYGANQSFTITPNSGYHIADVIVDQTSVGAVAIYTFTNVIAPHTISSTFAINTYILTVNAINGTVSKSPDQPTYNHGTSVQLTATPNTGYSFVSWSGDLTGSVNPVTITMDANKNITANFALNPPTITNFTPANGPISTSVTITGTNFISVTSVKFNGTIATYTVNSSTQITATVPTGATTGSITVTNTAGTGTSSTTFKVGYILTIQIVGSGTVLKNPNYLSYTPGATVTLTAKPTLIEALKIVPNTPEPISWKFDHWEIDLTGTQNPKNIIMNGNKTVKAVFVPVY